MIVLLTLLGTATLATVLAKDLPPSCDSPIYCQGALLSTIQMAQLYQDSKTFVDFRTLDSPQKTLLKFESFRTVVGRHPKRDQIRAFVEANFAPGEELMDATLEDFDPKPAFLGDISDGHVRWFTERLIALWPSLARKIKPEVWEHPDRFSIIPVPNKFIIPGGRFREYYYWDSLWIVEGLLISGMTKTVRGMVDNYISIVDRYGFIPNGGRIYYLQRSHPPVLTSMAYSYFQHTKDLAWLERHIKTIEEELRYWLENKMVHVDGNMLFRYNAPSLGPRPESYWEDVMTAAYLPDEESKNELYIDLKSGAESGWDFSARWIFDDEGGNNANLSYIATRRVIPVDLNSFLCRAFREISELYTALNRPLSALLWQKYGAALQTAIEKVLWNEESGIWFDYDIKLKKHRRIFYPSNVAPLWANCFDSKKGKEIGKSVLEYLDNSKILDNLGGIPTSMGYTGEQWDFPNAWAPLQDIVVNGLANSGYEPAKREARVLAERWVKANMIGFNETGEMFEKYSAVVPGKRGVGGEYQVQAGFGWSNGVCLKFIYDYFR